MTARYLTASMPADPARGRCPAHIAPAPGRDRGGGAVAAVLAVGVVRRASTATISAPDYEAAARLRRGPLGPRRRRRVRRPDPRSDRRRGPVRRPRAEPRGLPEEPRHLSGVRGRRDTVRAYRAREREAPDLRRRPRAAAAAAAQIGARRERTGASSPARCRSPSPPTSRSPGSFTPATARPRRGRRRRRRRGARLPRARGPGRRAAEAPRPAPRRSTYRPRRQDHALPVREPGGGARPPPEIRAFVEAGAGGGAELTVGRWSDISRRRGPVCWRVPPAAHPEIRCRETDPEDSHERHLGPRHDRPDPRLLGDPAQLGALDRPLRGARLQRARARPTRASRSRSRRSTPTRPRSRRSRCRRSSSTSRRDRRSRHAADPDRPLGRRGVHPVLLDHGFGAAGVAINSAPTEGVQRGPAVAGQGDVPGAEEPGQPAQGVGFTPSSGTTRSPTPSARRSRGRCTSATTSRRPGRSSGAARSRTSTPGHEDTYVTTTTTTARRCCSSRASEDHLMPPKSSSRTPSTTSRTRSPRSRSTRAGRTCFPRRRAGRRSPTTPWTGPSATRRERPSGVKPDGAASPTSAGRRS